MNEDEIAREKLLKEKEMSIPLEERLKNSKW